MMSKDISNPAILILAAGKSVRLGRQKQLLTLNGTTLIRRAIDTALQSKIGRVTVVLGSDAENIYSNISDLDVDTIINPDWQEGIAASIRTGISKILHSSIPNDGVLIMLCDQPFVSPDLLRHMLALQHRHHSKVTACGYAGIVGTPMLFHRDTYPALQELNGDQGARRILHRFRDSMSVIPFEKGSVDIDTDTDYLKVKTAFED